MKKIYIDPETWGPEALWDPNHCIGHTENDEAITRPAMCCLGFASEQLGVPRDWLVCESLPSYVGLDDEPHPEFEAFVAQCRRDAPYDFIKAANKLFDCGLQARETIEYVIANINDSYHGLPEEQKPEKLEPTLTLLKRGFDLMGYELVYGKEESNGAGSAG